MLSFGKESFHPFFSKHSFGFSKFTSLSAMPRFSLVDLKVFCAVADEGNLCRGAQRVHLSPSTVCSRIKGLEDALGVSLFHRTSNGMTSTPAGEIVRQSSRSIEREIDRMLEKLEPYACREAGTLRIVTNYGSALNFLTDGLARFLQSHPDVSVSHLRCPSREVVAAVSEDRADIGMGAFLGEYPGVEFIDYRRDDLVLIVGSGHRLAQKESIDFVECLDEDFVYLNDQVEMQRFVDEQARTLGRKITPRVHVSDQLMLLRLVSAGVGIGVASRVAYATQPYPNTHSVNLSDPWARRYIRIAIPARHERRSRWVQSFLEALQAPTEPDALAPA